MGRQCFTIGVALAFAAAMGPAHADIYTWVGKNGEINISNLPPPEGTKVTSVSRASPKDAAREAAAREAARQAEVRALSERVEQLSAEVEQSRSASIPPPYAAPPAMAFAPPAPAPTFVVNVINQPAQSEPAPAACDNGYGYGCGVGLGFFPGYTYYAPAFQRGWNKPHRKWAGPMPTPIRSGQLIPPLIPYPTTHPIGGRRLG